MKTDFLIDLKDDYNRALRARQRKRALALGAVIVRDVLVALGIGSLCALVGALWFTAAAIAVVLAGSIGRHHLNTRH